MILVFDKTYSESVLDGSPQSLDSYPAARIADPTDIDELRLYFLYPEWQSGLWAGMRKPRSSGTPPMRMKSETQITSVFEDGHEYVEKMPTPVKNAAGKVIGLTRYPMARVTPKDRHPGRTRRDTRVNTAYAAELS